MIDKWLIKEFENQLKKPEIYKVLFFDVNREYEKIFQKLIPLLSKTYKVVFYEGSFLKVKHQIEMGAKDKKWIIYLPILRKEADYIKEYEFTSYIFEKPLLSYLRRKGVRFPSDKEEKKVVEKTLPILAERSVGRDKSFWEGLTREKVAELIFPEFYLGVLKLIESPEKYYRELKSEGIDDLFFDKVKKEFGVNLPQDNISEWVNSFLVRVFLTEAYVGFGEPDEFPFIDCVSKIKEEQGRIISFLENWAVNAKYRELFKKKSKEVEAKHNLTEWVKTLSLEAHNSFSFLGTTKIIWEKFIQTISSLDSKKNFIKTFKSFEDNILKQSKSFWSRQGEVSGWLLCQIILKLLKEMEKAKANIEKTTSLERFIESYAEEWWKIDRYYREFKMSLLRANTDINPIAPWVELIYKEIVQKMNSRFSDVIDKLNVLWSGKIKRQKDFWQAFVAEKGEKMAIFYIDALRYELGKVLEERLSQEFRVTVEPLVSEIPTETAVGMSMLLPHEGEPEIAVEEGKIVVKEGKTVIRNKEERKERLKKYAPDICFIELEELNKPDFKQLRERFLVVFSIKLDSLGSALGTSALSLYVELLRNIEKGVKKVFEWGTEKVFIVSDHGFYMLDKIKDIEKIEIKCRSALVKSERYILGKGLEKVKAPGRYDFLHGGLTLQEVVTPLIIVDRFFKPLKVSVKIKLGKDLKDGIRNQIFKIVLCPETKGLFGDQPRTVRIFCEKDGRRVSNEAMAVVKDNDEEVTLRLESSVKTGKVVIKAVDDETLERLDKKQIEVYLEFDMDI